MAIDVKKLFGVNAATFLIQRIKLMKQDLEAKISAKSDFDGKYSSLTGAPESLKNPAALTFTGAVEDSYDGSAEKTINIPDSIELNVASADALGGVKAETKGAGDTVEVKVDAEGKMYVPTYPTYTEATGEESGLLSSTDKTKLDTLESGDTYAKKTDIAKVYKFKGSLTDESELTDKEGTAEEGDVYNLETSTTYGDGMNVAWDGSKWDPLGMHIDLSDYIKKSDLAEIDNVELDALLDQLIEGDITP